RDLNDPVVRGEVLGQDRDVWDGAEVVSLRLQPGQDASCNNLYQATQPQVLGVPQQIGAATQATPFQWAATGEPPAAAPGAANTSNPAAPPWSPWDELASPASGTADDPVPLVLDQNTAM